LNVAANNLRTEGAKSIEVMIKENKTLTSLDLGNNKLASRI